jgi:hypothetical protein
VGCSSRYHLISRTMLSKSLIKICFIGVLLLCAYISSIREWLVIPLELNSCSKSDHTRVLQHSVRADCVSLSYLI